MPIAYAMVLSQSRYLTKLLSKQLHQMYLQRSHAHRVRDGFFGKQVPDIWLGESTDPNVPAEERLS